MHKFKDCDTTFSQMGNLKKHVLTHTKGNTHKCTDCENTFPKAGPKETYTYSHWGEDE